MKSLLQNLPKVLMVILLTTIIKAQAPGYKGDDKCMLCHNSTNSKLGYNIYAEYIKTGHPYKLNKITGNAQPTYPANTTAGYPAPSGKQFSDFSYVIGGYGWKARFLQHDGMVFVGQNVQYNLATKGWVAYNDGKPTKYDYNCFKCHTTGPTTEGSWPAGTTGFGTFAQPGIRCEGCHGPASDANGDHTTNPTYKPFRKGDDLTLTRCGDCHQRGGVTNAVPTSNGFVEHHEQVNEFRASKHGDGKGVDLTCGTCHDTHIALHYKNVASPNLKAIKVKCQDCHTGKEIKINGTKTKPVDCVDCHMSYTGKSAIGTQTGNGWKGDIRSHVMQINTNNIDKTNGMFTTDGLKLELDANGLAKQTLDFTCLSCHTNKDLAWASTYAKNIHSGITGVEKADNIPAEYALNQNYPNPFNPTTTITFALPKTSNVKLEVYTINGELMATLIDNVMPAGNHKVTLDASRFASGVYIYKIQADKFNFARKMVLMK